jgi:deoxyadenosine/deoxycytidine kinase
MTSGQNLLVAIIGNNAAGKTSLAKALGRMPGFSTYLESHEDRPYQALFSQDPITYALPNQIDYLLARAGQERRIRAGDEIGVQDGGLDQDFLLYTRLFHHKGFLDERGCDLCTRLYNTLRQDLPAPDAYIYLQAPLETLRARLLARARAIDLETIVTLDDLPVLQKFLDEWVSRISPLTIQADRVNLRSENYLGALAQQIEGLS